MAPVNVKVSGAYSATAGTAETAQTNRLAIEILICLPMRTL
jgi:hypothetical protein